MSKFNKKIRIAIQNKGRLMEPSLAYLKACGLQFTEIARQLVARCENNNIELLFVRNSDIPEYVKYGVADYGIVGQNVLLEKRSEVEVIKKLGFGRCDLVIAVPQNSKIQCLSELDHERIATSYPNILRTVLRKKSVSASIIEIQGSVEICPFLGLADAIFDITQTGKTLNENGLRVIENVSSSQAVIIKKLNTNPNYENIFI